MRKRPKFIPNMPSLKPRAKRRRPSEEAKLVRFFNSDEWRHIGEQGDHDNLSPAETAIRAIRNLRVELDAMKTAEWHAADRTVPPGWWIREVGSEDGKHLLRARLDALGVPSWERVRTDFTRGSNREPQFNSLNEAIEAVTARKKKKQ